MCYSHAGGDEHFQSDRAEWYQAFTGVPMPGVLEADLSRQNEAFDVIARRFRAYSDGRV